jgi:hypothetical protein
MRVFVSWSGEKSRRFGEALRSWLPNVHQRIEVFFSPNDIEKGAKWATEIETQLRDTQYCVVCLTPDALKSPWINFEAGAISKGIGQNRITPVLLDLTKSEVSGPLSHFQLTDFNKEEMRKVLQGINGSSEDGRLTHEMLNRAFDRWWPDLENDVIAVAKTTPTAETPAKSSREIAEETLLNTREIVRQMGAASPPAKQPRQFAGIVNVNIALTKLHGRCIALEETDILPYVHHLGRRVVSMNSILGKTGGDSLVKLRRWVKSASEAPLPRTLDETSPPEPPEKKEESEEKQL